VSGVVKIQGDSIEMDIKLKKIREKTARYFDGPMPEWWDWIIPGMVFAIAFVCYDQAFDMRLSMLQASDLLHCIFSGKPLDFYSCTLHIAETAGYLSKPASVCGAIYNIMIYLTMAVWALPVFGLNLLFHFTNYPDILNMWGRVLVIGLSLLCAYLVTGLFGKLTGEKIKSKWAGYYFATAPVVMFSAVIFNQYDIFSVTATLLSLYFFFDRKFYKFSLLMSLAISYKLFALFIYLPLILLAEKRLLKLVWNIILAMSVYGATTFLYKTFDAGYDRTQKLMMPNFNFYQWIYTAQIPGGVGNISVFIFCFIVILALSCYLKPKETDFPAAAIYLGAVSYASFFIFVNWHPQWVVIIVPFITMTVFSMKSFRLGVILDITMSAGYMIINSLKYFGRTIIDNTILVWMLKHSYNGRGNANPILNIFARNKYPVALPATLFAGCLAALLLMAYMDYKSEKTAVDRLAGEVRIDRSLLYIRATVPLIYYMLPPLIYYFGSLVR
jgi:hypothetical protein